MDGRCRMTEQVDSIVDISLAAAGRGRISWAATFMPALAAASRDVGTSLSGRRVGVFLTLEPKTANLALALAEAGAAVSVYSSGPHTSDDVAAALAAEAVRVYARSDADSHVDELLLNRFLDDRLEFLIDDGAGLVRYVHTKRRDALTFLAAAAEQTTSGVRPLRVMEDEGALEVPCVAVNDALTKQLFDNVYGTGQSVVMTLLDVTNVQLQGKVVVVVGYGYVGRGISATARAFGARVVVTEVDPVRALQAVHDGYSVSRLETVSPVGDIFFTATGIGYSITADQMRLMKNGAIVAVGGGGPPEVSLTGDVPLVSSDLARDYVRTVPVDAERSVFLIADGESANVTAGEGNSIEVIDLSLAVQLRVLGYLADRHQSMDPGVHEVPPEIDDLVARSALAAHGAEVDDASPMQIEHARSWRRS
jgi:adenosylhomocysteinase